MKPTKQKIEYEKISTDDFVIGVIEDIIYEKNHEFKYQGEVKKADAVRLKFHIDGYKYSKPTPWMTFSYGGKTNLFTKYISSLVDGAVEDMDFDLDQLKGLKVKMLWKDKGDFQHIETIRPVGKKIVPLNTNPDKIETAEVVDVNEENDAIEV